jgi:hypothetical protein
MRIQEFPTMRRICLAVAGALGAAILLPAAGASAAPAVPAADVTVTPFSRTENRVAAGPFTKIYDPSVGESGPWYINDHTFVRADDGTWHLFGITHEEPADPEDEDNFAHATAPSLRGPWTKQPFALSVDPGYFNETHLWAPHVIKHQGTYYMFYNGGGDDPTRYAISLATSKDLFHWTRRAQGPLFRDGFAARDPYVTRIGNRWVMFYTANGDPAGGNHVVAYRTSDDLLNWSERQIAYTDPARGTGGGPTESPFVVRHGAYWYLFIGPRPGYVGTDVFRSTDPLRFRIEDQIGHVDSHAAEVIFDADSDAWYASAAGWGQGGVYLAPLEWRRPVQVAGVTAQAPGYRATVTSSPATALTELSVPRGDGTWRNLLGVSGRGTVPYLAVGAFGDTDRPGAAARTEVSGTDAMLRGVPLGDEPVAADWSFRFAADWLDTSVTWHVTGATSAPVWEAALSVDPAASAYGDEVAVPREGDIAGFPRWTLASDPGGDGSGGPSTVALAYRAGSAWAEANRWFGPPGVGFFSWQPLWRPGGQAWPPGDYAGGTWRVGVSPRADDRALAEALHAGVNG